MSIVYQPAFCLGNKAFVGEEKFIKDGFCEDLRVCNQKIESSFII